MDLYNSSYEHELNLCEEHEEQRNGGDYLANDNSNKIKLLLEENFEHKLNKFDCLIKIGYVPREFNEHIWITTLCMSSCNIMDIKNMPPFLINLDISNNVITKINNNALPDTIEKIDISSNKLTSISNLPRQLVELNAAYNELVLCDFVGLAQLETVSLEYNELSCAPYFENSVESIDLSNNMLTIFDSLYELTHLETLDMSGNKLTLIRILPPNLKILTCANNEIKAAINFPHRIEEINLSSNNISHISNIPDSVTSLDLSDNELTSLFKHNSIPCCLEMLSVTGNGNLKLDDIKKYEHIEVLNYDENAIIDNGEYDAFKMHGSNASGGQNIASYYNSMSRTDDERNCEDDERENYFGLGYQREHNMHREHDMHREHNMQREHDMHRDHNMHQPQRNMQHEYNMRQHDMRKQHEYNMRQHDGMSRMQQNMRQHDGMSRMQQNMHQHMHQQQNMSRMQQNMHQHLNTHYNTHNNWNRCGNNNMQKNITETPGYIEMMMKAKKKQMKFSEENPYYIKLNETVTI